MKRKKTMAPSMKCWVFFLFPFPFPSCVNKNNKNNKNNSFKSACRIYTHCHCLPRLYVSLFFWCCVEVMPYIQYCKRNACLMCVCLAMIDFLLRLLIIHIARANSKVACCQFSCYCYIFNLHRAHKHTHTHTQKYLYCLIWAIEQQCWYL